MGSGDWLAGFGGRWTRSPGEPLGRDSRSARRRRGGAGIEVALVYDPDNIVFGRLQNSLVVLEVLDLS